MQRKVHFYLLVAHVVALIVFITFVPMAPAHGFACSAFAAILMMVAYRLIEDW